MPEFIALLFSTVCISALRIIEQSFQIYISSNYLSKYNLKLLLTLHKHAFL